MSAGTLGSPENGPIWSKGRPWCKNAVVVGFCLAILSCGSDGHDGREPFVAVLAAFPAELAALIERADITEAVDAGDRTLRVGTLGGVRVVVGMTGIGLINAERSTRDLLARFDVTGVVVSGVAGSPARIGDVAVPEAWAFTDGARYEVDPDWLDVTEGVARAGLVLERCTVVPATGEPVCLPHEPAVVVGGVGQSGDSFGDTALPCQPEGDDVFGCDIPDAARPASSHEPAAADMETAAIAAEAAAQGLPFIAFRAVSDGEGDPLGLPGFPAQFFAYYPLASANAAEATRAFLERLR